MESRKRNDSERKKDKFIFIYIQVNMLTSKKKGEIKVNSKAK